MSTVEIDWTPQSAEVPGGLFAVADSLAVPELAMIAAREIVQDNIRSHFEEETSPEGVSWAYWAPSYEPVALAHPNVGVLRRDEALYDAAGNNEAVIIAGNTIFYNTGALPDYGVWHHTGLPERTTQTGRPNPLHARPFIGVDI